MYDPTIGRWISQDPLGFEAGDTNLYRYVNNRTVLQTAPNGLDPPDNTLDGWYANRVRNWYGNFGGGDTRVQASLDWFSVSERNLFGQFLTTLRAAVNTICSDLTVDSPAAHGRAGMGPYAGTAANRAKADRWFGNGVRLTDGELCIVRGKFKRLRTTFITTVLPFENTDSTYAVAWNPFIGDIHLGRTFWTQVPNPKRQVGIILHEMTHKYLGTADHGYFHGSSYLFEVDPNIVAGGLIGLQNPLVGVAVLLPGEIKYSLAGNPVSLTTAQLINNADTYEGYAEEFYL